MKELFAILLLSAMLLFGCASPPAQQGAAPQAPANNNSPSPGSLPAQTGTGQQTQPQPAPAGGSPAAAGSASVNATAQAAPAGPDNQPQGTASPPPAPAAGPQAKEFTVLASQWQFSPSTITVNKGDTVKITLVNKDVSHGISIPDFGFDLKAGAGQTASGQFTADKAGTFQFRCNVFCGDGHRDMVGTLIVQ